MERIRCTSAVTRRLQIFQFAEEIQQINSVFTEQSRIGVMNWLSRYLISHVQPLRIQRRKMNEQKNRKLAPEEVNTLVKAPEKMTVCSPGEIRKSSARDFSVSNFTKNGYVRTVCHVQCFRTIHDVGDGFTGKTERYREYTHHTVASFWSITALLMSILALSSNGVHPAHHFFFFI